MHIISLNNANQPEVLSEAVEIILRGGTVVYPTETSYGLGGDFFSEKAYDKVLSIKARPEDKALPVIVTDFHLAETLVAFSALAKDLAERFWPGPLTLALPVNFYSIHQWFTEDTLALRVSSHPFASELAKLIGRPLIATSANVSGQSPCYSIADLVEQLGQRSITPDLIIDAGALPANPPSTVVRIINDQVEILRPGSIDISHV